MIRKAYVHSPGLSPDDALHQTSAWRAIRDLPPALPDGRLPQYLWDLISWNEESIVADSLALRDAMLRPKPAGAYHVLGDEDLLFGAGIKLEPNPTNAPCPSRISADA